MNVLIRDRIEQVRAEKILVATGASENMIPVSRLDSAGHNRRWSGPDHCQHSWNKTGRESAYGRSGECRARGGLSDASSGLSGFSHHRRCSPHRWIRGSCGQGGSIWCPFFMSHTITEAGGEKWIESATISQVDKEWKPIPGTEKKFELDTVCIAVGLNPMTQLLDMLSCKMVPVPSLGGRVPAHDLGQETSIPGIYVAGDSSGIEEASTAIIEGRIAGLAIAHSLGYIDDSSFLEQRDRQFKSMVGLRSGSHGEARKIAKEYINAVMKG